MEKFVHHYNRYGFTLGIQCQKAQTHYDHIGNSDSLFGRYVDCEQALPERRTVCSRQSNKQKVSSRQKQTKIILQDSALNYRVLNFTTNTFNENNTAYWHKSVGGYHAAKLRRYQEMIDHHIGKEMQAAYRLRLPMHKEIWIA